MMAPNRRKGYPRDDLWLRHRPRGERVKKWTVQARCRYYALSPCGRGQLVFCRSNDWVRGSFTKPLTHSDSWAHHCALSRKGSEPARCMRIFIYQTNQLSETGGATSMVG